VYVVGEIGYNALDIATQITRLGEESIEPIYLVLTSPGGSVLTGGQVIAAIESSKAPVYTVCNVLCASMAAMIFEYGAKRYIGDRSFLMFHPASGGAEGELDKMISRLLSMQRYIGKMEAYTGNKAKLTFEQYKARSAVENWIDGEDAVNSGFADHIATVSLPKGNPFDGLFGAKALYDAIYHRNDPTITVTPGVYSTNPADFSWIVPVKELKWFGF
jgi:ATP-dependent Clp protease protease subunit